MRRRAQPWGTVYRPRSRNGTPTKWWWLKFKFPGEAVPRRECTNPRTADKGEAKTQLHARLGEPAAIRVERERIEDITVNDLLDLYVLHCEDEGQANQVGRVEVWRDLLGPTRAIDVRRDHLDAICRGWRAERGPMWTAGHRVLSTGRVLTWRARDSKRVQCLSGASCNRYMAALRSAFALGKKKRHLDTALTFPHFKERRRGTDLTEDQCRAICANFQARFGASVKADVFRLAYLIGIRKGQLRRTRKRHVLIQGDVWKLKWSAEETKNGEPHEVVLGDEECAIVQRAWAARLPDCDFLFHVNGKPLGPMLSELKRTCALLDIPYGRASGVVWHDTRHAAVTNLVGAGVPEVVAMSITGHIDPSIFKRYNNRRDDVQVAAAAQRDAYLVTRRGTTKTIATLPPRK